MFKAAVLTVSDRCSRGECEDVSGKVVQDMIRALGGEIACYDVVPDEKDVIKEKLITYCDRFKAALVLTTGGTGLGPRDVTPEATEEVAHKTIPGISEVLRLEGMRKTKRAMLSRGISVLRGASVIVNLPGSPKGVRESLESIGDVIPHALEMVRGGGH